MTKTIQTNKQQQQKQQQNQRNSGVNLWDSRIISEIPSDSCCAGILCSILPLCYTEGSGHL